MATTEKKPAEEKAMKMVKIRLPRSKKNEPDKTVGINGVIYKIKRGVEVEVPENVALLLRDSERAEENYYAHLDAVVSE